MTYARIKVHLGEYINLKSGGAPLFIVRKERSMELIQQISKMIEPILEEHDCYEDEIVYEQENNEWYLRIFIE